MRLPKLEYLIFTIKDYLLIYLVNFLLLGHNHEIKRNLVTRSPSLTLKSKARYLRMNTCEDL